MTIARNSLWTLIDNLLGLMGMLLASVAVARTLGPTKVGHYNHLMWVVGASGALALLGIYLYRRLEVRVSLATPLRVALVSAFMFAIVRAIVLWLPPLPALLVALPVGVVVVMLGLRVLRCLHPEDRDRLIDAAAMLPVFARDPFVAVVGLVAPPVRGV